MREDMDMANLRKLVGAVLGGLTATALITILGFLGVNLDPELAAAVSLLLASLGTWAAPPNEPRGIHRVEQGK